MSSTLSAKKAKSSDAARKSAGFTPQDAARLASKHGLFVVIFAIIAGTAAFFYARRQPRVYRATTTVNFDFSPSRAALGQRTLERYDPYTDYLTKQETLETQFKIIRSRRITTQVAIDTGLRNDADFMRSAFPNAAAGKVPLEAIAIRLQQRIAVSGVKGTNLAKITYEDTNPKRAQRLVSAIVDTYIRLSNEDSMSSSTQALEWLGKQVKTLKVELNKSEMALHTFKLERNLVSVSLNDQANILKERINALSSAVTQAQIKHAQLSARARAVGRITRANPDHLPSSVLLSDETLTNLRKSYFDKRAELAKLKNEGKLENHPDVRKARSEQEVALKAFLAQVRNLQRAAAREAAIVSSEAGSLRGMLNKAKKTALDLNLSEIEYNRLRRQSTTNERLYKNVFDRMREVDLTQFSNTRTVKVVDAPLLPRSPIRPRVRTFALGGVAAGVFLGVLLGVLRELLDRSLKTPTQAEAELGVTSLGLLPKSAAHLANANKNKGRRRGRRGADLEGPELLVHSQPTCSFAEAARSIRSNILFMSPDNPPRFLAITSASPKEGKTTSAATIATTFAQAGEKVLLVDLDLRRPRLHRVFGAPSDCGLTSILLGQAGEEAIVDTPVPNLDFLPSGPTPPNPAELLMSDKMKAYMQELGKTYDRVIIDTAPINPVTDTVVLSTWVDGILFVARAFSTSVDQAKHAVRSLLDVNANVLGVVLNDVDLTRHEYKYSYYTRANSTYYGPATPSPSDA